MKPSTADLRALSRRDAVLGAAMRRHGPVPHFPRPDTRRMPAFDFLARSICFQQLAFAAANTIWRRTCELTPGPGFPPPAEFLRLPETQLRAAGLSRNKQAAVRDLATHFACDAIRPAALARGSDEEVIAALTQVHGIGRWTAQMYLIFKLGRPDVLPTTDLGVQEGAKRLYGLRSRPDPDRLQRLAAAWAPLRSVGAWACWAATDAEG